MVKIQNSNIGKKGAFQNNEYEIQQTQTMNNTCKVKRSRSYIKFTDPPFSSRVKRVSHLRRSGFSVIARVCEFERCWGGGKVRG